MSNTWTNVVKAEDIATKAAALVSGDRAATHGDKADNFGNIATYWNAFLLTRADNDAARYAVHLTGADVAKMMALLKLARMESGKFNPDDAVDACGYAAIAGELGQPVSTVPDTEPPTLHTPRGTKR
jgi:hypothetical protein